MITAKHNVKRRILENCNSTHSRLTENLTHAMQCHLQAVTYH
jgi:hypothetical protein